MLMVPSALVTLPTPHAGAKKALRDRPDPLKVNGNILALGLGKGY
jgi:hypothetical protein